MTTRPTIAEIKIHSRIDNDIEDDYLQILENGAYSFISDYMNLEVVVSPDTELTSTQIEYNDQMKIAELMIIDAWYTERKCDNIPKSALFMLDKYRIMNT